MTMFVEEAMTTLTRFSTDGVRLAMTQKTARVLRLTCMTAEYGLRHGDVDVEGDDSSEAVLRMYAEEVQKLKQDSDFNQQM